MIGWLVGATLVTRLVSFYDTKSGATLVTLLVSFYDTKSGATQNRTGSSGVRILHRNHVDHSTHQSASTPHYP